MFKEVIIPEKHGIEVKCNCGYEWTYAGKSKFYASCPRCRSTVVFSKKRRLMHRTNYGGEAD
jgi:ribosomal protein S27E